MIEKDAFVLAVITNVASMQASGAVSLRVHPVRAKVGSIGEVQCLQARHRGKLETVTLSSHGGVNKPLIIGVVPMDEPETSKGLVDKYESDDCSEYLLSESSEELHHSTRVECHQAYHEECTPHSNPEPEIEEWNTIREAEIEDDLFKDDSWSSGPEDHQRLTREDTEDQIANSNC